MRAAKALTSLRICAGSREHSLLADAISTKSMCILSRTQYTGTGSEILCSLPLSIIVTGRSLSTCPFILCICRHKCSTGHFENDREGPQNLKCTFSRFIYATSLWLLRIYGSLSKNGGIVVLFNFLAYVPSIFLFLCLQHLATLWVTKTEYYVRCPMTLFENST